jgi:hypothetical protein
MRLSCPWERRSGTMPTADKLAEAVSLDITGYWRPEVRTYLGRITKARILAAVREAVSAEAADRMCGYEEAEHGGSRRAGTAPRAAQDPPRPSQADDVTQPKDRRIRRRRRVVGLTGTDCAVPVLSWSHRKFQPRRLHDPKLSTEYIFKFSTNSGIFRA